MTPRMIHAREVKFAKIPKNFPLIARLPVLDDAVVIPGNERVAGMAPRHRSHGARVRLVDEDTEALCGTGDRGQGTGGGCVQVSRGAEIKPLRHYGARRVHMPIRSIRVFMLFALVLPHVNLIAHWGVRGKHGFGVQRRRGAI